MKSGLLAILLALVVACFNLGSVDGFLLNNQLAVVRTSCSSSSQHFLAQEDNNNASDNDDYVAKRIIVKGDVQGGYYRSCVLNEVRQQKMGDIIIAQ
jgi:hypothetical protein